MKGSTEMNSWLSEGCHISPMKVGLHNSSKGPTFKVRASKLNKLSHNEGPISEGPKNEDIP